MKVLRIALAAAALTLAAPRQAHAQCGGSTFATCASVSITKQDMGGGVTRVVMTVTNNSGQNGTFNGTVFTAMGLWGLGNFSYVANSLVVTGAPQGNWALGTPGLSGAGISPQQAGTNPVGSVNNGLLPGQTVTFTFDITGVSFASVDVNDWAIHGQNGPTNLATGGSCSTKLVSTDGVLNAGPYDPNCALPSVTPEPASMVLLGTGLAGLAGGAAVRRRRARA